VIADALEQECTGGGSYGFQLTDIRAKLIHAEQRDGESNEQAFRIAVAEAVRGGLEKAGVDILEPIMKLETATPEDYLGEITSDLMSRRASIHGIDVRGPQRVVTAHAPLRQMFGYSTVLRSLSQGRASYSMEPLDYQPAPADVVRELT
jgi:elongation factor G